MSAPVVACKGSILLIEEPNKGWTPGSGKGRHTVSKDEFDRYVSGEDAMGLGFRIHLDYSPMDSDGHVIEADDPRLQDVYVDLELRWNDVATGGGVGQTEKTDGVIGLHQCGKGDPEHGCTPVLTVDEPSEGRNKLEARAQLRKMADDALICYSPWVGPVYVS